MFARRGFLPRSIKTVRNVFRKNKLIMLIMLAAFVLRVPATYWGISLLDPAQRVYHPDEPKTVIGACKFPPELSTYAHPTLYHYFLGIASMPVKMVIPFGRPEDFMFPYLSVYLYARLVTILFGTATVFLLYLWGSRIKERAVGLLASGFLAVSAAHVLSSSVAVTYVPLAFFVTACFWKLDSMKERREMKDFFQLGLLAGLAFGMKFTGLFLLAAMAVYAADWMRGRSGKARKNVAAGMALSVITAFIVLALSTPTIFSGEMWSMASYEAGVVRSGGHPLQGLLQIWGNFRELVRAVGTPLALLFIAGLVFPGGDRTRKFAFAVFLIGQFIYFDRGFVIRYHVGLMPVLAFFSAEMIWTLHKRVRSREWLVYAVSVVFIYSLVYTIGGVYLRLNDTRTRAAEFIAQNVPGGTRIAMANASGHEWHYHGWRYPSVDFQRYRPAGTLAGADVVIFTSFDFENVLGRIDRHYAGSGGEIADPTVRFYDLVLNERTDGYRLIGHFKKGIWVNAEFASPEIRIYERVRG